MDANSTAIVLTGGDGPAALGALPEAALVVAADSGLALAEPLRLRVDLVVGDMDSVDPDRLASALAGGAEVERHPEDKDSTDLELALHAAVGRGATRIIVLGGSGGRLDHLLGNALLLASPAFAAVAIEWWAGSCRTIVVHEHAGIEGSPGDLVTLLPIGGPAFGITTTGLRWQLSGDSLEPGSTRGISNEMTGDIARITLSGGTLLVIHRRSGA